METAESILTTVRAFLGKDDPEGVKGVIQQTETKLEALTLRIRGCYENDAQWTMDYERRAHKVHRLGFIVHGD